MRDLGARYLACLLNNNTVVISHRSPDDCDSYIDVVGGYWMDEVERKAASLGALLNSV